MGRFRCPCSRTFDREEDRTHHQRDQGCAAYVKESEAARCAAAARVSVKKNKVENARAARVQRRAAGIGGATASEAKSGTSNDGGKIWKDDDIVMDDPIETHCGIDPSCMPEPAGTPDLVPMSSREEQASNESANPPGPRRSGRANQGTRPARYRDDVPTSIPDELEEIVIVQDAAPLLAPPGSRPAKVWRTKTSALGLYREYIAAPTHIPDAYVLLEDLLVDARQPSQAPDLTGESSETAADAAAVTARGPYHPYPNLSLLLLDVHYWSKSNPNKSLNDEKELIRILNLPGFENSDLLKADLGRIHEQIECMNGTGDKFVYGAGWRESTLTISVPLGKGGAEDFSVPGFLHKSLVELAIDICENDPRAEEFHYTPFRLYMQPTRTGAVPERLFGEPYTCDAFIQEFEAVMAQAPEPGCTLPRAVLGLAFWSDATQAAQFGNAKLWPGYMMVLNQSKYQRCRPNTNACHHFAHFPDLPDELQDKIREWTGKSGKKGLFTHCRRELFHAGWELMLDEDFRHAYVHGIVVKCRDGIMRRLYLRILFYSADYPEKVLIATIRDLGGCPCPRCLMRMDDVRNLGMKSDIRFRRIHPRVDDHRRRFDIGFARDNIYKRGYVVDTTANDPLLKEHSWVATRNAFSALAPFGFDIFNAMVVDLMHEFELGVWKALLIHLIRMLHCVGADAVAEFNYRFRLIPTFGRGTVRRFGKNVSELKKLAARDFEDILQCIIPAIEGLLPEPDNTKVLDLIFTFALWHGLAKLRLHSENTLRLLEQTTTQLGDQLRHFSAETCSHFDTKELEREARARVRRAAGADLTGKGTGAGLGAQRPKAFSMRTYKLHSLGDYASMVRSFGTTDGCSTSIGELAHRRVKDYYERGSKNHYEKQVAKLEKRSHVLERLLSTTGVGKMLKPAKSKNVEESIAFADPRARYHISKENRHHEALGLWELKDRPDTAKQDFSARLRRHVISRLRDRDPDSIQARDFEADLASLVIVQGKIYWHSVVRVNYTTYDMHRAQDSINPKTDHCDIMMLSGKLATNHPYLYARVLRVFHVFVRHTPSGVKDPIRMDVLFVRWFARPVDDCVPGWQTKRLDRIAFVPEHEPGAFGFVDPGDVIRQVHLIPAFVAGQTDNSISRSPLVHQSSNAHDHLEWRFHYVNRFADRDALMRYIGGAPGHTTDCTQQCTIEIEDAPDDEDEDLPDEVVAESGALPSHRDVTSTAAARAPVDDDHARHMDDEVLLQDFDREEDEGEEDEDDDPEELMQDALQLFESEEDHADYDY